MDPYGYGLGEGRIVHGTACIGWLEAGCPYVTASEPVDAKFVAALRSLTLRWSVNKARGNHVCSLCSEPRDTFLENGDGRRTLLGDAELWIPAEDGSVVFVAPNLVLHYVVEHRYSPPCKFILAVLHAEEAYEHWDPQTESERVIASALA